MKKLIFTVCSAFIFAFAVKAQYPSQNITLLSTWDDSTITAEPWYGIRYSGIWGWDDGNGREYGIIGSTVGYHVIEVTNPALPVERAFIPGCRNSCIWRELKTYGHYLYCVSDDASPNCMIIADLSYLPDSVHIVHQSNNIIERAHTIYIDGNKLYAGILHGGSISGTSATMGVFSLNDPENPVLLKELNQDYPSPIWAVHDMIAYHDTIIASCATEGIYFFKYDSIANHFVQIAPPLIFYPGSGYSHSSAITDDRTTLVATDEVNPGLPLKTFNISNLQNIAFADTFRSVPTSTATPHNPFMMHGNICVVAYYQDGLQIFDVSNANNPVRLGFIDTNPTNGTALPDSDYTGCWGAYVNLPSGIILASDMQNGLFVLDISSAVGIKSNHPSDFTLNVAPNPANEFVELNIHSDLNIKGSIDVMDIAGKIIFSQSLIINHGLQTKSINISGLKSGVYLIRLSSDKFNVVKQMQVIKNN